MPNSHIKNNDPVLDIQRFLFNGGTLGQLREQYKLIIVEHEDGRVMFNYDQIDSPRGEMICQESRGLILEKGTWELVSLGFHRFFNSEELPYAHTLDFNSQVRAFPKIDGSYVSMYYYKGMWRFSTRGSIDASGSVGDFPFTFKELIDSVKPSNFTDYLLQTSVDFTYIFELVSPYNKIVTPYEKAELILIGARKVRDTEYSLATPIGFELDYKSLGAIAIYFGVKFYEGVDISNLLDVVNLIVNIKPTDEGFVVVEQTNSVRGFRRVKMKNASYVALHHLKSSDGCKNLAVILQKDEDSEVASLLPELKQILDTARNKIEQLIVVLNDQYELANHVADKELEPRAKRKIFAENALTSAVPGFLFEKYNKPALGFREIIRAAQPDKIAELIGLKNIKLSVFNQKQEHTLPPAPPTPIAS